MISGVDVLIPVAPKDEVKLPFVLDAIERCLTGIEQVHIVSPNGVKHEKRGAWPIVYHRDDDVLPFDWNRVAFRPTWIKQQMIKLFQAVTADWYLVIDADRFLNTPQALFHGAQPILFLSTYDQNWPHYFEYSQKMIGVGRVYPHSFISECTLYNRDLITEMLTEAGLTIKEWLEKSAEIINVFCMPGESELYGNWLAAKHPDFYEFKVLRDERRGKEPFYHGEWTEDELRAYVADMRVRADVDMFTAHSWHD